jgi:hypothetical protein
LQVGKVEPGGADLVTDPKQLASNTDQRRVGLFAGDFLLQSQSAEPGDILTQG